MNRRCALEAGLVLLGLVVVSLAIRGADLDLSIQRRLFTAGGTWAGSASLALGLFYDLGPILPGVLAGLGLVVTCLSLCMPAWRIQRRPSAFLVLCFLLGPGLLVNGILKEGMQRPRPRHLEEFGGRKQFVPVLQMGSEGRGTSFPSGHASMGAYLLAPFFLLRRRRVSAAVFLGLGLVYGGALGLTRMLQGGHFLSDVLWALGLVYLTGLVVARALGVDRDGPPGPDRSGAQRPIERQPGRAEEHRADPGRGDRVEHPVAP